MIKLLATLLLFVTCAKTPVKKETIFDFKDFDKVSEQSSQKSNIKRVLIITDSFMFNHQVEQMDILFRYLPQSEIVTFSFCDFKPEMVIGKINSNCGYFFRSFLENMSRGLKTKEYEIRDYLDFYRPQFLYFVFQNSQTKPQTFPVSFKEILSKYNLSCLKTEVPSNRVVNCFNDFSFTLEKSETLTKELNYSLEYNNVPFIRAVYKNFNEAINSVAK
ncbi:MAG: hypothetical protein U0T83_05800 [Bacteriovoracaceae bacterium]